MNIHSILLNYDNTEVQVGGTTLQDGQSLVGRGPGNTVISDSTHKEWEDADGSKTEVRDYVTPLRRAGNFGTQGYITDSDGGTPGVLNQVIRRIAVAKPNGSAGGWGQYYTYPEGVLCYGMVGGDSSVEATVANCVAGGEFPVTTQGFLQEIQLFGLDEARNGVNGAAVSYTITHRASNGGAAINTWSYTFPSGNSTMSPVIDLRTNLNTAGETLSTVLVTPGESFEITCTTTTGVTRYIRGLTLMGKGILGRIGNAV